MQKNLQKIQTLFSTVLLLLNTVHFNSLLQLGIMQLCVSFRKIIRRLLKVPQRL